MPASPLHYLREHPGASRKEVMRACACSARAARRAEEELRLEQGRSPRRLGRVLAGATLALAVGVAYAVWPEPEVPSAPRRREAVRAEEAAIYSALDLRDERRAREISQHLASEEESLRLAALRFLASVDPLPYLGRLLPLVDDESPRVRRAAVQLLGGVAPSRDLGQERVTEALVGVLGDSKRSLAERTLAATSLRRRRPQDVRGILPALEDPRLSARAGRLLEGWTGRRAQPREGESLRAAWERTLGAGA